MKRLLFTSVLLGILSNIYCQDFVFEKPNYAEIKKITIDKNSKFYYPTLLERYSQADTTLTLEESRTLYYGYLFNENYSLSNDSEYVDSVNTILSKDTLLTNDYYDIIKYETLQLQKNPFSIRDLNYLANSYYQLDDTVSMTKINQKIEMIINAIMSTGDGKTDETGWHVISVSHEYDIINYFGYEYAGEQSLTTGGCDYLSVSENEYEIKGFYFDVNKILEKEGELLNK